MEEGGRWAVGGGRTLFIEINRKEKEETLESVTHPHTHTHPHTQTHTDTHRHTQTHTVIDTSSSNRLRSAGPVDRVARLVKIVDELNVAC